MSDAPEIEEDNPHCTIVAGEAVMHGAQQYIRADRIAELEAKLKEASLQSISDLGQAQDAYQAQLLAEAKLAEAVEALDRIAYVSDVYSVEANAEDQGADTLAYAHKSICKIARTTLAELTKERSDEKGQDDE